MLTENPQGLHCDPTAAPIAALQLISIREVERLTSLKHSTLYALIHAGEFPVPIKVTSRRSAWIAAEVDLWIEQRALNNRARGMCKLAGGERVS